MLVTFKKMAEEGGHCFDMYVPSVAVMSAVEVAELCGQCSKSARGMHAHLLTFCCMLHNCTGGTPLWHAAPRTSCSAALDVKSWVPTVWWQEICCDVMVICEHIRLIQHVTAWQL